MKTDTIRDAFENMNLKFKVAYPMKKLTTLKVGGPALVFVKVKNIEELQYVLKVAKIEKLAVFVIGKGSNLLVSDNGFDGIVIALENEFASISIKETKIQSGAGFLLPKLAYFAMQHSLSGLEFASQIPGTIGGAVYMNAGAHGSSIFQHIDEIFVWSDNENKIKSYHSPFEYGYRFSFLQKKKEIVLSVIFSLIKYEKQQILKKMEQISQARKKTQPLNKKSAGSIFKNSSEHKVYSLINELGLQGYRIGNAEISNKHSNFIINRGQATAKDIYQLILLVQEKVKEKFNITLEKEIEILGDFA